MYLIPHIGIEVILVGHVTWLLRGYLAAKSVYCHDMFLNTDALTKSIKVHVSDLGSKVWDMQQSFRSVN